MRLIKCVSLAVLAMGCGAHKDSQLKGSTSRPLLIAMGGFSTCATTREHGSWESPLGMPLHSREQALRETLRKEMGTEFDVILSCFTKLAELRYVESQDNFKHLYVKQSFDEYIDHLHAAIADHDMTFIVGHSYGGWLSLKMVSEFRGSPTILKTLYSIDPISRRHCRLEDPLNWGNCTVAPPDLDDQDMQAINDASQRWINYWQNQTFYLHSAPIKQADENRRSKAGHMEIDNLAELWASQLDDIRAVLLDRPFSEGQKTDLIASSDTQDYPVAQ